MERYRTAGPSAGKVPIDSNGIKSPVGSDQATLVSQSNAKESLVEAEINALFHEKENGESHETVQCTFGDENLHSLGPSQYIVPNND